MKKKKMIIVEFDTERDGEELQQTLGLVCHVLHGMVEATEPVKILTLSERAEKQLRSMIVDQATEKH